MRENRTYGSEGGGAGNSTGSPYPYHDITPSGLASEALTHFRPSFSLREPLFFAPIRKSSFRASRKALVS